MRNGVNLHTLTAIVPHAGRKSAGQAMVVVTLCMLALLSILGLVLDGGLMYAQRRKAQNAVDAAALASTQKMLDYYDDMLNRFPVDVDYGAATEAEIKAQLDNFIVSNGLLTDTVKAYFVNDENQVVTVDVGPVGSPQPTCGASLSRPCMVGQNGEVPWTLGAKGIQVKASSRADALFMKFFGYDTVSASADATAFMGVATGANSNGTDPDLTVFPIGVFTSTHSLLGPVEDRFSDLTGDQTHILIQGDSRFNSENWGQLSFNGSQDPRTNQAWLECGYNPTLRSDREWDDACPAYARSNPFNWGPTQYWTGEAHPSSTMLQDFDLRAGTGSAGWWIGGSLGSSVSNCNDLANLVDNLEIGRQYLVPIVDSYTSGVGVDAKFHLRQLEWFSITRAEVDCHVPDDPLNPAAGEHQVWLVVGQFLYHYSAGAPGRHGDLRHTSERTVFLGS
jgi:hypothetical protein